MSDAALAYETLDKQSQMEVDQLIFRLVEKKKNASYEKERTHSENIALVKSFMGKSHAWDGTNILDYQKQLRGEYRENV